MITGCGASKEEDTSDKPYTIRHLDLRTSTIDYYDGEVSNITNNIGDNTLRYKNVSIDSTDNSYIEDFDISAEDYKD